MVRTADISKTHPLNSLCEQWLEKIAVGCKIRHERFGQYAEEATRFYDGNHDWMWQEQYARGVGGFLDKSGGVMPNFRISVNKLFEAVALFGPALYHQNPNVQVSPLEQAEVPIEALGLDFDNPAIAEMAMQLEAEEQQQKLIKSACASVKQRYLNWLQYETDKKTQSRRAITEGIVAGLGLLYTDLYQPPFSKIKMPRSTYLSWKDFVADPDADYWEDAQWIAVRRVHAVNLVERKFNLTPGDLKGHMQSLGAQATPRGKKEVNQNRPGESFDLIEYWEVFSKNGFGDRLRKPVTKESKYNFDVFGDYCYLVVAKGIPFPLNMPSDVLKAAADVEELFERSQWPIPYWYDASSGGGWPVSRLMFYDKPKDIWPISIFKPAIGELRFVNWCLSFLADKVASSCNTYVGVLKAAGVSIQKQIAGQHSPFTVVEISDALGKTLKETIEFLQAPNFSVDIWNMLAQVLDLIDKRTGITELMYGMSKNQMRSATEANVRNENLSIRPDDMAQSVENWLSETNVREMQCARWFCEPQDVAPSVGTKGAYIWQQYVMSQDVDAVVRDFDYRIEAGSARKPNKANRIAALSEFGQQAMPTFQALALQGMIGPFNAFMADMAKALDIDPTPYLVEPQEGSAEDQAAQAELELKVQEFELKLQEMQAKLGMEMEVHEVELAQSHEKHEMEMEQSREKMTLEKEKAKTQAQVAKTKAKQAPKKASA